MRLRIFEKLLQTEKNTALPRIVNRKNTYILPTRHGLLFLLVLLAMLAGSVNYNNNLGFLLVFLLGSMAVVSMFHTHGNLAGLKILSASARPVFAGDTAAFELLVSPQGVCRRALVWRLENQRHTIEDMPAESEARILVKAETTQRGMFTTGPLTVSTRFPLGLFYAWTQVSLNLSCVVYPRPLASPFEIHEIIEGNPGAQTQQHGSGVDDFMGLKIYQPGDAVRQISWKTLSRGQGLFTKEFAGHGRMRTVFAYDRIRGRDMEDRLSRLCDMVRKAAAVDMDYGLNLPGTFIAPDRGPRHRHRCLKALALFGRSPEKQ